MEEPRDWTDRERAAFDGLVFDAYDSQMANPQYEGEGSSLPLEQRHSVVTRLLRVPGINICVQSADHSVTGQRLAEHASAHWWDRQIQRYTGVRWRGTHMVGRNLPQDGPTCGSGTTATRFGTAVFRVNYFCR